MTRTDSQINFDWGTGTPSRAVSRAGFSAVWQGNFTFQAGTYTFTATVSDGVRLFIDGALVLDKWVDQPPTLYTVQQTLTAGSHLVVVEYYTHSGSATAHLSGQKN